LDEGGSLIKALHEHFPEYAKLCVAVEHTERGMQIIDEMAERGVALQCPVVCVARSWAKKIWEAPMIGESVAHSIETALQDMGSNTRVQPKQATVIGYGAVGKATAAALMRRGYDVSTYDINP